MQTLKTYIKKVKLINPLTLFKKWLLTDLIVDAERLEQRVDSLENNVSVEDLDNRVDNLEYDLEARIESVEDRSETNQESIKILKYKLEEFHTNYKKMTGDLGTSLLSDFKIVNERLDNLEELAKKYLNAELQSVVSKQEKTEQSLSDMQRLAFEICHYYGGQFDINDFDNCYEIISKYDVVWKRNPQPKKTKKQGGK